MRPGVYGRARARARTPSPMRPPAASCLKSAIRNPQFQTGSVRCSIVFYRQKKGSSAASPRTDDR